MITINQAFAYQKSDEPYQWANTWTACEDCLVMGTGRYPQPHETTNMIVEIGGACHIRQR